MVKEPQTVAQTLLVGDLEVGTVLGRVVALDDEPTCFVAKRGTGSMGILEINYASGRITNEMRAGLNPDRLTLTKDRQYLYCTNRHGKSVGRVNLRDGTYPEIRLSFNPHGLVLTHDESRALVGTLDSVLLRVNLATSETEEILELPQAALVDLVTLPYRKLGAVSDLANDSLWVFAASNLHDNSSIRVEGGPLCLAVDTVLSRIYCTCRESQQLAILQLKVGAQNPREVAESASVKYVSLPVQSTPVGVAVSPNGERVFISLQEPNGIAVYHVDTGRFYPAISLTSPPVGVHATSDSRHILITAKHSLVVMDTFYGFGMSPTA